MQTGRTVVTSQQWHFELGVRTELPQRHHHQEHHHARVRSLSFDRPAVELCTGRGCRAVPRELDDPDLAKRGWYDITAIRLAAEAQAGKSCIEYEWTGPDEKVSGSSAMRRGFCLLYTS